MKILCLGASFTGRYLATHFPEHTVRFLSRSPGELQRSGYPAYDAHSVEAPAAVLDTVPAVVVNEAGDLAPVPYHEAISELFERHGPIPYVHVSSTSVLPPGESGEWYDETSPPAPGQERGERRLRLEEKIRTAYPQARILRSAGIYGPGRSVALQFRDGNFRRTQSGNAWVSRIHVHDLVRLFLAMVVQLQNTAIEVPDVVHGVDERPTENREVFAFLENELGITVPGPWREEAASGRRVRSLYAKDLLNGEYRFPTYVEGFRSVLAGR